MFYSGAPVCRNLLRGLTCIDGDFCQFSHMASCVDDELQRIEAHNAREQHRTGEERFKPIVEPTTYGTLAKHGLPDFQPGRIRRVSGNRQPS